MNGFIELGELKDLPEMIVEFDSHQALSLHYIPGGIQIT
jgi:hypothetical protein